MATSSNAGKLHSPSEEPVRESDPPAVTPFVVRLWRPAVRGILWVVFLSMLTLSSSGCSSVKTWFSAHADAKAWGRAASPLNPNHAPALVLLASEVYFADQDDDISESLAPKKPFGGDDGSDKGDRLLGLLAAGPIFSVGYAALFPKHEHEALELAEIGIESFVITGLMVEGLKRAVGRERPDNNSGMGGRNGNPSTKSFPSGHVAGAMLASTLTGRWLRSRSPRLFPIELAMYAATAFIAITRIENDKHFPTDVVAGAIIGSYIGNTVWDAHYGRDENTGIFHHIYRHVAPIPLEDGMAVLFSFPF